MTSTTIDSLLLECEKLRFSKPIEAYALIQKAVKKALKSKDLFGLALANELRASLARLLGDLATAQASAQSALLYFRSMKNIGKEANCLVLLGQNTYDSGNLKKAINYYREAEHLVKNSKDDVKVLARSLGLHGITKLSLGQPAEAFKYLIKSLDVSEQFDLSLETGIAFQALGTFYFLDEDYDNALAYANKSLTIFRMLNDKYRECFTLNNLGIAYSHTHQPSKSLECFDQAAKIANQLGMIYMIVWSHSNLIEWNITEKHFKEAARLVKKLLSLSTSKLDVVSHATIFFAAASYHMALNKPDLAIKDLRTAMQKFSSFQYGQLQTLEKMLEIFIQINDTDKTIKTLKEYLAIKDEIFSIENQREISHLEADQKNQKHSIARDEQLEKYSQHRYDKNQFILSLKKKYAHNKKNKSAFEIMDSQVAQMTDAFDHELYISMTYDDFLKRLSKRFSTLSSTELKIAALLRLNMSSKKIASLLSISIRTVEFHRTNIRKKLNLKTKDNVQLVLMKI